MVNQYSNGIPLNQSHFWIWIFTHRYTVLHFLILWLVLISLSALMIMVQSFYSNMFSNFWLPQQNQHLHILTMKIIWKLLFLEIPAFSMQKTPPSTLYFINFMGRKPHFYHDVSVDNHCRNTVLSDNKTSIGTCPSIQYSPLLLTIIYWFGRLINSHHQRLRDGFRMFCNCSK
jgi:hypothetical protein